MNLYLSKGIVKDFATLPFLHCSCLGYAAMMTPTLERMHHQLGVVGQGGGNRIQSKYSANNTKIPTHTIAFSTDYNNSNQPQTKNGEQYKHCQSSICLPTDHKHCSRNLAKKYALNQLHSVQRKLQRQPR